MQLILKQRANKCWYNLLITFKVAAFISDEHKDDSCRDIVLAQHLNNDVSFSFEIILYTYNAYTLLYYILIF